MIHGRNGKRKTPAEIAAWKREHQAAQQLATAGPSDAEFLVTSPLDVAALPPPAQPTLDEWRELATRFAHMLECWHEFYQHGGALADCPTIACRAVHAYQELTERAGGEPCNGA